MRIRGIRANGIFEAVVLESPKRTERERTNNPCRFVLRLDRVEGRHPSESR
jgi:hypothetical protein